MAKLRLSAVEDDRPVKLTVELPAAVHRDLVAYAEVLARQNGQKIEPAKLVAPMLARFTSGAEMQRVAHMAAHHFDEGRVASGRPDGCHVADGPEYKPRDPKAQPKADRGREGCR